MKNIKSKIELENFNYQVFVFSMDTFWLSDLKNETIWPIKHEEFLKIDRIFMSIITIFHQRMETI